MAEILSEALSVYGHACHVLTGRDALDQIKGKAPDVILLDLKFPDMNGLEVAKLGRRNEKTSCIPVLAISGNRMNYKKCFEVGCKDFIQKPFSLPALLARLSELILARS
jgi:CheY-like chemotaxis protein